MSRFLLIALAIAFVQFSVTENIRDSIHFFEENFRKLSPFERNVSSSSKIKFMSTSGLKNFVSSKKLLREEEDLRSQNMTLDSKNEKHQTLNTENRNKHQGFRDEVINVASFDIKASEQPPKKDVLGNKTLDNIEDISNQVTLRSNSILCTYYNIKDVEVKKRSMKCNDLTCNLNSVSDKSSHWLCGSINCYVANVDYTQSNLQLEKLLECSLDARSIITVQDKPCGADEKLHNGKCRKIFGA